MSPTVLIVEDNPQNLYLAGYLLKSAGFEVVSATDGLAAVAMAGSVKPDIVLMDILLPVIDGYEAAKRIKSDPVCDDVPIIALTAYSMDGDEEAALAAGCDGYISKPIDPSDFAERVARFLDGVTADPSHGATEPHRDPAGTADTSLGSAGASAPHRSPA